MESITDGLAQLNTALFIDFDNIYLNLAEQDKQAAEKFATAPDLWLDWLEQQLPLNYRNITFGGRRLLIRRCYLNPNSFAKYRPFFIRSGCEVIDCPPLTARGKTSTDIHLVMDALESLSHSTYFHEFIIFSGDADFTPLLLNLRKHARYSVVLPVGLASQAYKSACDYLINTNTFVETVLGIGADDESGYEQVDVKGVTKATENLLRRIGERVYQTAMSMPSGVPGNDLPEIYKEFPEFKQGNHWLGFYSLKRLTEAIVQQHNDLTIMEDEDSWYVTRKIFASWLYSREEKNKTTPLGARQQDVRSQVADWIKNLVAESPTPIVLSVLAQSTQKRFAGQAIGANWLGAMTFKNLLQQLDLGNLVVSSWVPGYLYDPDRHTPPTPEQEVEPPVSEHVEVDEFSNLYPDIAPLAQKIHRLTDMPYLTPRNYAILFEEIAREVNLREYQMTRTSRTVRDQCLERGAPIARSHVNFVLTGLNYIGHHFNSAEQTSAWELGEKMIENTVKLCRTAQFELNPEELDLVKRWLVSKIDHRTGS
jgi:hypothetical protein